jgi:hypothetical protein
MAAKTAGPSVRRTAAESKTPVIIAERKSTKSVKSAKSAKSETRHAKTRDKGGKGAIQLAAASKKERKRKGSRH